MGQTKGGIVAFPVLNVRLVNAEKVVANDYNPNKMMPKMLRLLKKSITEDGVTQPIVTYYDAERDIYIIVDGFHRYTVLKQLKVSEMPIVTIDKDISERRISTIRHNKAKGTHQLDLVKQNFQALVAENRFSLPEIADKIGAEAEEVVVYTKKGSIIEEFKNQNFSNAWERDRTAKLKYESKPYDEMEDGEL
jgi:ParB-like chromosome segregation protein Spo0J